MPNMIKLDMDESDEPLLASERMSRPRSSSSKLQQTACTACSLPTSMPAKTACLVVGIAIILFAGVRYEHRQLSWSSTADLELPGVPQEPLRGLSDQEARLRSNTWKRPPPDPNLLRFIDELPESQGRVREWLRDTRPEWERGKSIGIAREDPPEPIRTAAPVSRPRKDFPRANEGPGHFEEGDPRKYYDLVQEWQLGRKEPVCQPAKWQDDYREMHKNMLAEQTKPRFLVASCLREMPIGCGGLADRMLNVATSFLYSMLTNRSLLILWEHPYPVDLIFDSVNIDWSFPFDNATSLSSRRLFNPNESDIIVKAHQVDSINLYPPVLDQVYEHGYLEAWKKDDPALILHAINRGLPYRSFASEKMRPLMFDLGFKHDTIWACIIDYLVRPKYTALQYIAEYSSYFALPSVYSIGIQIRTGDSSMRDHAGDHHTVAGYEPLFRCAEQVAAAYARPSQRVVYFLVSDSMHLKQDAVRHMPDKIITTNFTSRHVDHFDDPTLEVESMTESVITSWIMAHADFSILTPDSGFGRMPTWRRAKQGRVIETYGRTGQNITHCGLDTSVSFLSELAQTWSYG